jgi:hypothetical protein
MVSLDRAFLMVLFSYGSLPVALGVSGFEAVSRCDVRTPKGCVELLAADAALGGYRLRT